MTRDEAIEILEEIARDPDWEPEPDVFADLDALPLVHRPN